MPVSGLVLFEPLTMNHTRAESRVSTHIVLAEQDPTTRAFPYPSDSSRRLTSAFIPQQSPNPGNT